MYVSLLRKIYFNMFKKADFCCLRFKFVGLFIASKLSNKKQLNDVHIIDLVLVLITLDLCLLFVAEAPVKKKI